MRGNGALLDGVREKKRSVEPRNPVLHLVLGAAFVNGWTDAPNAIATVVGTRSLSPRAALAMASVFNFLGVLSGTAVAAAGPSAV